MAEAAEKAKQDVKPVKFFQLESDYWIASSVRAPDVKRMAEQGFKSVVNLVAEQEKRDPTEYHLVHLKPDEARKAVEDNGMVYREMPVYGFMLNNPNHARGFAEMVKNLPRPMMVYCLSGQRSVMLWGMVKASDPEADVEEIMDDALDVMQDIYPIEDGLQKVHEIAKNTEGTPTGIESMLDQCKPFCEMMEKNSYK